MSNNFNSSSFINNIIVFQKPLPPHMNTFNNFGIIQYKGKIVPRINIESNNYKINEYSTEEDNNNTFNQINPNIKDNIEILIESNDKQNIRINEKINKENSKTQENLKDCSIINNDKTNYIKYNNILFNGTINNELIPPKSFISIIEDEEEEENDDNNNNNKNKMNNYEYINNIIFNNLDKLTKDYYYFNIINNNFEFPNNINIMENPTFYKYPTFNFFNDIDLKEENPETTPVLLTKKKKEKNLFTVSSTENIEIRKNHSKRGRKLKLGNGNRYRRVHGASDYDNILRKIQVHYLNFIICYINDVIKAIITDKKVPLFKSLDYKIKKIVNFKYFEEMKAKPISEILKLKISPKIKISDKDENKKIYNQICSICPFFEGFCQKNYLSLFKEYYKNEKFEINGIEIKLSIRTKTFSDLVKKNYSFKDRLHFVAKNYFFADSRKQTFKTSAQVIKKK